MLGRFPFPSTLFAEVGNGQDVSQGDQSVTWREGVKTIADELTRVGRTRLACQGSRSAQTMIGGLRRYG